jgi:hypothetical protein
LAQSLEAATAGTLGETKDRRLRFLPTEVASASLAPEFLRS